MLVGCDKQKTNSKQRYACQSLNEVVWLNKQQTIQTYKDCIGVPENYANMSWSYEQIDSMLYLSYIYLTDTKYKDIEQANTLLEIAKEAMWQDCDDYHGHYDNFCYFEYFKNEIPTFVNNLEDAIILYQMSLPCVHIDMIMENEKTLEIINGWFGSSRDVNIPAVCETFDVDKIIDFDAIRNTKSYSILEKLNKEPVTDGTIRFGFNRTRYHDLVYMLTYPQKYFITDNFKKLYIKYYAGGIDTPKQFFAYHLEKEINKHQDIKNEYKNLKESIKNYYISFLHMQTDDAVKYAHMTASMIILQDIFIR